MRSPYRDTKHLHAARYSAETQGVEMVESYGEPFALYATIAPENGQQAAAMYGVRLPYIKRLTGCTAVLRQGDGVWIEAEPEDEPDYRVTAVLQYARSVEYLVEKRGVYGG